ncbi:hypothetical protein Tco_0356228 [Tanacetum coccineum]
MYFRSFMMEWIDGEFHFEPEGGFGNGEGSSPSTKYVNNEAQVIDVEPLNSSPPLKVAENIEDSYDLFVKKDVTDEVRKVGKSSKVIGKWRQIPSLPEGELVKSDPDIHEFPSAKELKDSTDCHWVVAYVTHLSWKQHLKEIIFHQLMCHTHSFIQIGRLRRSNFTLDVIRQSSNVRINLYTFQLNHS